MVEIDNYYDCRDLSAEEILLLLMELYPALRDEANRKRVYIGATGNLAERLRRHNVKEVLFCARTANRRVAARVEELANQLGFEIGDVEHGGNGTNSFSLFVYAFDMTLIGRCNQLATFGYKS